MKITKLRASSLRGLPANWPEVEIGECGLVIYGPNGTGKSSIIDAIEFALKGASTHFADPRQGVNWPSGAPHVRGGQMNVEIATKGVGGQYPIVGGVNPPTEISAWCAQAARSNFVLRRHMLLRFVDTTPAIRYNQIEPFLDLTEYRAIENALAAVVTGIESKVAVTEAALRANEQSLRSIFVLEATDAISEELLVEKLNILLAEAGLEPTNAATLAATEKQIHSALGDDARDARLAMLHSLKSQAQKLTAASNYREMLEQLHAALLDLEGEFASRRGLVFTEFLAKGKELIADSEEENCPICEQQIDRASIISRLTERIEADSRITAAKSAVLTKIKAVSNPPKYACYFDADICR